MVLWLMDKENSANKNKKKLACYWCQWVFYDCQNYVILVFSFILWLFAQINNQGKEMVDNRAFNGNLYKGPHI